jgi:hypothetical protein
MPFHRSHCAAESVLSAIEAAGCMHMDSGDTPLARSAGTVSGTLAYRQRRALPPGSVIHVGHVEVRGKTSETVVLAERSFPVSGQVSIPFAVAEAGQPQLPRLRPGPALTCAPNCRGHGSRLTEEQTRLRN